MSDVEKRRPTILVTALRPAKGDATDPSAGILSLLAADPPGDAYCRTLLLPDRPDDALLKAVQTMDHFLPDAVLILGVARDQAALSVERVALRDERVALRDERVALNDERVALSEERVTLNGPCTLPAAGPASDSRGTAPAAVSGDGDTADALAAAFAGPVDAAGPAVYSSTLPVEEMVARMRASGVPAKAGTEGANPLCNRLHYALLHYIALRGSETWFRRLPPAGLVSRVGSILLPPAMPMDGPARKARAPALPIETSLRGVNLAIGAVIDFLASASEDTAAPRPAIG